MKDYHMGNLVKARIKELNMNCSFISNLMGVSEPSMYRLLTLKNIPIRRLIQFSEILRRNFFLDLADCVEFNNPINYNQNS